MEKLRYADLLDRLEGFDPWLTSLGLTARPNDRIHEAFKVLRRAEEASRKGHETGIYVDIRPGDWFPVVEALEAHDIFAAFRNDPSPAIAPTLKRAKVRAKNSRLGLTMRTVRTPRPMPTLTSP